MNPNCNCSDNTTIGRIIDIDRTSRHFTTISDGNRSSIIRFNVPEDARIFDIFGRYFFVYILNIIFNSNAKENSKVIKKRSLQQMCSNFFITHAC